MPEPLLNHNYMLRNLSIMFYILSLWALHMYKFIAHPELDNLFLKGKSSFHLNLVWHVVIILCTYKRVKWKNNYLEPFYHALR